MKEKDIERILKAIANRRRIAMLLYVRKTGEASVGEIARAVPLSIKATSKHLALLASVGIVEREQRSIMMFYRITPDAPLLAKRLLNLL